MEKNIKRNAVLPPFRLLFYFSAIIEAGSLSKAARRLGVTRPAVSGALKNLQKRFEAPLVERDGLSVRPTALGMRVHEYSLRMVDQAWTALDHPIEDTPGQTRTNIKIAVPNDVANVLMPDFLRWLGDRRAHYRFTVIAADLPDGAQTEDVDLAMTLAFSENPVQGPAVLQNYPLRLFATAALAETIGLLDPDWKGTIPLIAQSWMGDDRLWLRYERSGQGEHWPVDVVSRVNSGETARKMAIAGVGAVLLPSDVLYEDTDSNRLVRIGSDYDFGYLALHLRAPVMDGGRALDRLQALVFNYAEERAQWRRAQRFQEQSSQVA